MTDTPRTQPTFAIVVGLKFSDGGSFAFDQAARMAQRIPGTTLHLVHVFESELSKEESTAMAQHLRLYANEKAFSIGPPAIAVGIHLRAGDRVRAIVQLASDVDAGLIVLGAEKHAIKGWFATPTAEKVIATATCPVLVAGPKPKEVRETSLVIEPACPDCLTARHASNGRQWWCPRHTERALVAHTFSYEEALPFETRDTQLGPTGV